MFFWNSLVFPMRQWMLAIWSLVPLPFLKSSLYIWKFTVHVLLMLGLDFEHYFASMSEECNCVVVTHGTSKYLEKNKPAGALPFFIHKGPSSLRCSLDRQTDLYHLASIIFSPRVSPTLVFPREGFLHVTVPDHSSYFPPDSLSFCCWSRFFQVGS